jgi:hypothetical protein
MIPRLCLFDLGHLKDNQIMSKIIDQPANLAPMTTHVPDVKTAPVRFHLVDALRGIASFVGGVRSREPGASLGQDRSDFANVGRGTDRKRANRGLDFFRIIGIRHRLFCLEVHGQCSISLSL